MILWIDSNKHRLESKTIVIIIYHKYLHHQTVSNVFEAPCANGILGFNKGSTYVLIE